VSTERDCGAVRQLHSAFYSCTLTDSQRVIRRPRRIHRRPPRAYPRNREEQGSHPAPRKDRPQPACQEEARVRKGQAEGRLPARRLQGRSERAVGRVRRREDWYFDRVQVAQVLELRGGGEISMHCYTFLNERAGVRVTSVRVICLSTSVLVCFHLYFTFSGTRAAGGVS
jgi:hypothetical protein